MNPIPDLAQQIDPKRLRATVEKLASYNTRNTLSETVKEAAAWLADQYKAIPGVEAELMNYVLPKGRRVPKTRMSSKWWRAPKASRIAGSASVDTSTR